jgi:DNA invertase Pin-like site-specific DNA recombinase
MNMTKITSSHLQRQAIVYVRQSTLEQVHNNLESQKRQYGLTDRARILGWEQVSVIDDDMGRSGSGTHRPGFERLLAALCEGTVGAVFSIEASRLARNGRDWHTLLEFCRLVDTLIIDEDGIYDARQPNDRLLLGMKGTLSEMEITTLRQRAYEAAIQKAKRGELLSSIAIGYIRAPNDRLEIDPDLRVREAMELVFRKFREFGSIRQVMLWLRQEDIELPAIVYGPTGRTLAWRLPVYNTILHVLTNPIYAGVYAYGRRKTVTRIQNGRKSVVEGIRRAQEDWHALIRDHHEGYINWDEYQANQHQIVHNAAMKGQLVRGPAREGRSLLAGLIRCGHCGRKLHVHYCGAHRNVVRYVCKGADLNHGGPKCISFGGLKVERLFEEELFRRLQPLGTRAALVAIDRQIQCGDERIKQKELSLEHARFEAARAHRQYNAVDPDNRLVSGELERRWNEALKRQRAVEQELHELHASRPEPLSEGARQEIMALGADVESLWHHPRSSAQLRKRIIRTVIHEIVVNKDGDRITMLVHWKGGDHTALKFIKNGTGHNRYTSPEDLVSLIRELARVQPDQFIAAILNRIGRRTARGHSWTAGRVATFRSDYEIPAYEEGERLARGELTMEEAAELLKMSVGNVRNMIARKRLPARQACKSAPWVIQRADVERIAASRLGAAPCSDDPNQLSLKIQ